MARHLNGGGAELKNRAVEIKNRKFLRKVFDKSEKDAKLNTRCRWSPEDSGWSGDSAEKEILKKLQKSIWQNENQC